GIIIETHIEDFALTSPSAITHQKTFLEIKWLLDASLRRIEFNKSERRNSYDRKNHHRCSHHIILYAGTGALFTGTPGASRASESRWCQKASQHCRHFCGYKEKYPRRDEKNRGKFPYKY